MYTENEMCGLGQTDLRDIGGKTYGRFGVFRQMEILD